MMSEDRPDLPIDLHKLAAQNGEGLAPELFALFDRNRACDGGSDTLVQFPARDLRCARRRREAELAGTDNVVAFRPGTGKALGR